MLKNKLFAGAIIALGLLVFTVSSAATLPLKVGSTGNDVKTVQTVVGATPVDGVFGSITKAKVMAWQANHSLVADGVVGPLTWAAMTAGGTTGGTLPAGCTSTAGYSTTTGLPCTTVSTLPAGCTSTAGYSSTTGAKCDGGTTSTVSGPLVGGAGDVFVTKSNTGIESEIVEGKSATKVFSFKVEADGSDVAVKNVKLTFDLTDGTGSTRLDHYVDGAAIWMGSTKVASLDVADFSKNSTTYTGNFNLSDAVVREGSSKKATFYVTVDASDISTDDEDGAWTVELASLRYQDATGVIMSFVPTDPILEDFGIQSSTEADELQLKSSTNNPTSSNLKVEDQDNSEDHLVLAFKLKAVADSSDLNILSIPITTDGGPASLEDIIDDIYLKVGSTTYDNYTVDGADYVFDIDEGDLTVESGDTVEVKVYASFVEMDKDGAYNYPEGQTVKFSVTGAIDVENVEGDEVASPTNDVNGNEHTLQLQSVNFKLLTPTIVNSSETASIDPYVTITMPLQVTTDEAMYVYKFVGDMSEDEDASVYARVDGGTGYSYTFVTGSNTPNIVSYEGDDYYEIDGTSTLYLKFIVNGDIEGGVGDVAVQLNSVWASVDLGDSATEYTLSPESSFDANATLRYVS